MRLIPADPDISTILSRIADRSLDLQPDFQRGSVWSRAKQRLLIDSILRDWYVPPIHVVRTPTGEQTVLDGQQRLRAIADFAHGEITVDGAAEPYSAEISALDGASYEELPPPLRRRFDRFTIRVFEVIDYEPEEPYELFFRLNQPTALTSAEKRNAFFGVPREQIRQLTERAQSEGFTPDRVGFSNVRLSYEDVLARFVWTLEVGSLAERVTSRRLTERYRSGVPFPDTVVSLAADAIRRICELSSLSDSAIRLNKATAHSWLCFVARGLLRNELLAALDPFFEQVERSRRRVRFDLDQEVDDSLLLLFNDRATSRVNDVVSVLLRDATLWVSYARKFGSDLQDLHQIVASTADARNAFELEALLLQAMGSVGWHELR